MRSGARGPGEDFRNVPARLEKKKKEREGDEGEKPRLQKRNQHKFKKSLISSSRRKEKFIDRKGKGEEKERKNAGKSRGKVEPLGVKGRPDQLFAAWRKI